jgi:hypothetical protein
VGVIITTAATDGATVGVGVLDTADVGCGVTVGAVG